jgi:hypothetical protein
VFVKEVKCAKMGFKKSSQDYRCGVLNKASPLESQWLKKTSQNYFDEKGEQLLKHE